MIIDNIRNGKKVDHFETVRVAKDGRKIDISLTVSPVKGKNGETIGASKVALDISEKATPFVHKKVTWLEQSKG